MNDYICKIATLSEMNDKWDYEIKKHPSDNAWTTWKEIFISGVKQGTRICYYGILNNKIITEGTAILDQKEIQNSNGLIDDTTAYLTAFRTNKEYQGNGYFSKLFKFIIKDLKEKGYNKVTIGVEPCEEKNMKIYFHWGFDQFIKTAYEEYPPKDKYSEPEKIIVNYYSKEI